MNIAILGWGSLIWDPRELPHYGPWKPDGPAVPVEFSRVSGDGRLTLVIHLSGPHVPTRFALSPRADVADAVDDLRKREGTVRKHIGFVIAGTGASSRVEFPQQVDVANVIKNWCISQKIDASVWTALLPNFAEETGVQFSLEHAMAYLEKLSKTNRDYALKYFRNAPAEVDTPLRRKVRVMWPSAAG